MLQPLVGKTTFVKRWRTLARRLLYCSTLSWRELRRCDGGRKGVVGAEGKGRAYQSNGNQGADRGCNKPRSLLNAKLIARRG